MIGTLKMLEYMEQFEEILDKFISIGTDKDFEELKRRL